VRWPCLGIGVVENALRVWLRICDWTDDRETGVMLIRTRCAEDCVRASEDSAFMATRGVCAMIEK